MSQHERNPRSLLLGEGQELRREIAADITIKCRNIRDPEAVEDRKQQQRVFGRLSERLSSLDEQACLIERRFRVRGRMALGMHERIRKPDLKLNLLAAQRWRSGQGRNLG